MNVILEEYLKGEKEKCIAGMVDTYYQLVISEVMTAEYDEKTIWPEDKELLMNVEDRPSGIAEAIQILLDRGCSINDADNSFTALQCAVGWADYIMTEYLINLGADPNIWADMDESDDPYGFWQNWYLDDIDIALFDEALANDKDVEFEKALIKTAHVLIGIGGLRDYHGYCLTINEDGTGEVRAPQLKF